MIQVKSSADFRAAIHNGFWFFKIIAIVGIMVGAFFIHSYEFLFVWRIFGMIGSLCFIVVQLTLIVDLAYSWNQAWIDGYEESRNRGIICGFIFSTILFYALAFSGIILFYVYFASAPACHLGKMLASINLILCVIFSIISILPQIREHLPNSGLLQSSIISAYVVFLTWSALVDIPIAECNPTLNLVNVTIIDSNNSRVTVETSNLSFNWQTGISITVTLLSIAFACVRNSSSNSLGRLTMDGGIDTSNAAEARDGETTERGGQTVWDNEKDGVAYSYAMFHFMMFLATHFVMMSITNWLEPNRVTGVLHVSLTSFWIKAVSSWFCAVLYTWTLVAPSMFPDRDFS
nr:serine incorporator 1 [Hymenolepis microstoma]